MNPSDTLSGAYGAAKLTMPDGAEVPVLVRKVSNPDGSHGWIVLDDKVLSFEASQADTEFQAKDILPSGTSVLVKKAITDTDKVDADLGAFLGDPKRIIAQKHLDSDRIEHLKKHPASLTMARRLCLLIGGEWAQVLQYLPKVYPETK
jgi:hypothetical protein